MNSGGQSSLEGIVSFFNMKSQTDNIAYATGITSPFISFAILVMQVLGFIAIGIWFLRIAADIVVLALPQFGGDKNILNKLATGKAESYTSAGAYIKGNMFNIVFVIVLTSLLMTGYLTRLIALFLSGVGTVLNIVFGLDIDGIVSASDASAYITQLKTRQATDLRNEYDEQLNTEKQYATQLYQLSAEGVSTSDSTWKSASRKYTTSYIKAASIAKVITANDSATKELKLGNAYFTQHSENSNVCNTNFADKDVQSAWKSSSGAVTSIKCNS